MHSRQVLMVAALTLLICSAGLASPKAWDRYWDPETALTVPPHWNGTGGAPLQSKVAVTSDGRVHVVWTSSRPNPNRPQVYYKCFTPGSGWADDTCISGDLVQRERSEAPAIACDAQDNVHVVWAQQGAFHIWYKMRHAAGNWDSTSTLISAGQETQTRLDPVLDCTPDGHVHAVWREWYWLYGSWLVYREKTGTGWGPTFTVDTSDTAVTLGGACVAGGSDNSVHIAYTRERVPGPNVLALYRGRTDLGWGAVEDVTRGDSSFRSTSTCGLAVNPASSEPHVLFGALRTTGPGGNYHTRRTGGIWQAYDTVELVSTGWPSVVFTPDGIGHAAWDRFDQRTGTSQVCYTERISTGEWLTPTDLTQDSASRDYVAITDGGRSADSNGLYLVWTHEPYSVAEVRYKHGAPSPQGVRWDEEMTVTPRPGLELQVLGTTRLSYALPEAGQVRLGVHDVAGRLVRLLVQGNRPAGRHEVTWDRTDSRGRTVAAGVYFCRFSTGSSETGAKVILR